MRCFPSAANHIKCGGLVAGLGNGMVPFLFFFSFFERGKQLNDAEACSEHINFSSSGPTGLLQNREKFTVTANNTHIGGRQLEN